VDVIDDGMEAQGGVGVEPDSGAVGDGGELVFEEGGIGQDVVGLNGEKCNDAGGHVETGEPDGGATAEIDGGDQQAEGDKDGVPGAEDGAYCREETEGGEESLAGG